MDSRVINLADYRKGWPPNTVYIGRGTPYGNPYPAKQYGREMALALFHDYAVARLRREPDWLKPLAGKILACHCEPLRCHGNILIELGA